VDYLYVYRKGVRLIVTPLLPHAAGAAQAKVRLRVRARGAKLNTAKLKMMFFSRILKTQ